MKKTLTLKGARIIASVLLLSFVLGIAYFTLSKEASVTIVASSQEKPIYNGSKTGAKVSLMFNVYEGAEIVMGILDVLDEYDSKCTFFIGGCWADDNNNVIEEIVKRGHELGNHGYFHLDHKKLGFEDNIKEIQNNHKLIKIISGCDMKLFAPPSGSFSENTLKACDNLGYKTIMWSKDTIDWRDKDENLVFKRATENIESGDLVLMHPKQHTLKALRQILKFYNQRGLRAVTVSECINNNDL